MIRLRSLAIVAAAAAAALLGSCKGSVEPPLVVTDTFAGSYVLRTIDGFPPPQIVEENGDSVFSIRSGVVLLREDSTFVDSTDVQFIIDGVVTDTVDVARGFIRTTGGSLTFYAGSNAYSMVRDDNTLTQNFSGTVLVYRK